MEAYSLDLRKRVFEACASGEMTQAAVADRYAVSHSFVKKLLALWRTTGDLAPGKPGGRRKPSFEEAALRRLRNAVRENPDATLEEFADRCGVSCCPATVHNTLKRLGYRRKKNAARQ